MTLLFDCHHLSAPTPTLCLPAATRCPPPLPRNTTIYLPSGKACIPNPLSAISPSSLSSSPTPSLSGLLRFRPCPPPPLPPLRLPLSPFACLPPDFLALLCLCPRLVGWGALGRGAEPPRFCGLSIWLEPGLSRVTWLYYVQQCASHVSFARYCPFCNFCDLVFAALTSYNGVRALVITRVIA